MSNTTGRVLRRAELLERVPDHPRHLLTVRGMGHRLQP